MFKSLRWRIFFYLILVSLTGIIIVSVAIQWGFETSFNTYLNEKRDKKISQVIDNLTSDFAQYGHYSEETINSLMHEQAMTEKLFYKVYGTNQTVLLDSTLFFDMLNSMGMEDTFPGEEQFQSKMYTLQLNNEEIGKLQVYFPEQMIGSEGLFINAIQKNIYLAVAITILLSMIFSLLFSSRLTSGFNKLSKAIQHLKSRNLSVRVPSDKMSEEMKQLAFDFNELADALQKQEMLRKQFTADLAHELRTPLATLRGQIEAFQDGIWEPTSDRLGQSHTELMRLVRLVNELEQLMAAENPQIQLNIQDVQVSYIVWSMNELFTPLFKQKGVHFQTYSSNDNLYVKGDQDRIIQILVNLLNNALKYTPTGNCVTFSIFEEEKMVGFLIEDEGLGISPDDLPLIFERFYRGDKSRDRQTGGIGIGLSIVKALVEAHDGKIDVKSTLHNGTAVTVLLNKAK